jgi:hypothetical protein
VLRVDDGCAGDDGGTQRAEGVQPLCARPLLVDAVLQITPADIVGNRIAVDIVIRRRFGDVFAALANDERQFAFPIDLVGDAAAPRNRVAIADDRAGVLREQQRRIGDL